MEVNTTFWWSFGVTFALLCWYQPNVYTEKRNFYGWDEKR